MSRTQEDRQQTFRQKLQSEGADSFADGPRPWEQWDESGIQGDNRVWEGTARRIYPQRKAVRRFGDQLLSGLAVVALGTMLVGIAGVILSTPSTPRQARSTIQPPPIVASKTTIPAPAATVTAVPADTPTPVIAKLETLSPPAAGIPAPPKKPQTILEPTMTSERNTTPVIQTDNVDRVAVETVITEGAVTTTVYTRQPSQDEPEMVAMIATNAPPFTHTTAQHEETPVAAPPMSPPHPGQNAEPAIEPLTVAGNGMEEVSTSSTVARTDVPAAEPDVIGQTMAVDSAPAATGETTAATPALAAESEGFDSGAALVEQATALATAPLILAQADGVSSEPAAMEETLEVDAAPAAIEQTEPASTAAATVEQTPAESTAPAIVVQTGTVDTEAAAVEETLEVDAAPAAIEQTEPAITAAATVEQTPAEIAATATAAVAETVSEPAREVAMVTPPAARTGNWVINLSSYTRKRTAERMLAVFRHKGVDAEVFSTTVNDKPMYRIRVAGFESARSAKAEISTLEKQLGLEGTWVSKR